MKPILVQTINTIAELAHKASETSSLTLSMVDKKQFYDAIHYLNLAHTAFKGTKIDDDSVEVISFNLVTHNLDKTAECIVTVTTIA